MIGEVAAEGTEAGELTPAEDNVLGVDEAAGRWRALLPPQALTQAERQLQPVGAQLEGLSKVALDFAFGAVGINGGGELQKARVCISGDERVSQERGRCQRVEIVRVEGEVAL